MEYPGVIPELSDCASLASVNVVQLSSVLVINNEINGVKGALEQVVKALEKLGTE